MLYGPAADLVVVVHAALVIFVLVGGYLAWRWPRVVWAHLPAVAVVSTLFVFGADCPLTDLEKYLRGEAGQSVYHDGFIAHYLLPGLPDGVRAVVVPVSVVAATVGAYLRIASRQRRRSQGSGEGDGPTMSAPVASRPSGGRYSPTGVRAHHAPVSRRSARVVNR